MVVDDDDLEGHAEARQIDREDLVEQLGDEALFVVGRDDDREHLARIRHAETPPAASPARRC